MTSRRTRAGVIVNRTIQRCRCRPFHGRSIQTGEMAGGKLRCIMACRACDKVRIDVTVMSPRDEAVIFCGAICVTGSALGVHIDCPESPGRRGLPAVTAHLRARTIGVPHRSAAFCIISAQEHDFNSTVVVIGCAGPCSAVAAIAHIRHIGQGIVHRMR